MDGLKNLLETEHSGPLDTILYVDSHQKKALPALSNVLHYDTLKGFPDMLAQR